VNVNLGRRTGGYYFNGRIDEVRIYNRALTQAEIVADMNTPLGAPPPPPVLGAPAAAGEDETVAGYELDQNVPNPSDASTTVSLSFRLPRSGHTRLEVFNVLGERIAVIVDGHRNSGSHVARFETSNLPSGVYLVRLAAGPFVGVRKLMLLK
jgi:hypothetical protein